MDVCAVEKVVGVPNDGIGADAGVGADFEHIIAHQQGVIPHLHPIPQHNPAFFVGAKHKIVPEHASRPQEDMALHLHTGAIELAIRTDLVKEASDPANFPVFPPAHGEDSFCAQPNRNRLKIAAGHIVTPMVYGGKQGENTIYRAKNILVAYI